MKIPCTCEEAGCLAQLIQWTINRDLPRRIKAGLQPIRIPKALSRRHQLPLDTPPSTE